MQVKAISSPNPLDKFRRFMVTSAALEAAGEQSYILNGSIAIHRITTIYASPNQGKTTFSIALARLFHTLYFDAENPLDTFPEFMLSKCQIYSASMGASIDDLKAILQSIIDEKISDKLLIVDTLSHFANPNDNKEIQVFYQLLQQIKNNGNTIVVLHHTNKGNPHNPNAKKSFFGSSVIQAQTDTMLYLEGFEDGDGNIIVTLEPEKRRGYIDKKSYKVSTLTYEIEEIYESNPEQLFADQPIIDLIAAFLTEPKMTTDILDHLVIHKVSKRKTGEILNRYVDRFWNKGGSGKKREWILIPPLDEPIEELPLAS